MPLGRECDDDNALGNKSDDHGSWPRTVLYHPAVGCTVQSGADR